MGASWKQMSIQTKCHDLHVLFTIYMVVTKVKKFLELKNFLFCFQKFFIKKTFVEGLNGADIKLDE